MRFKVFANQQQYDCKPSNLQCNIWMQRIPDPEFDNRVSHNPSEMEFQSMDIEQMMF